MLLRLLRVKTCIDILPVNQTSCLYMSNCKTVVTIVLVTLVCDDVLVTLICDDVFVTLAGDGVHVTLAGDDHTKLTAASPHKSQHL